MASLVYEKGLRWSFKRRQGSFRVILKRLVKDVLSDYFRELGEHQHPILVDMTEQEPEGKNDDLAIPLEAEELADAVERVLPHYPLEEQKVIRWIWDHHGLWPRSRELAEILELPSEEAARQWKHRHQALWEDFQERLQKEDEE